MLLQPRLLGRLRLEAWRLSGSDRAALLSVAEAALTDPMRHAPVRLLAEWLNPFGAPGVEAALPGLLRDALDRGLLAALRLPHELPRMTREGAALLGAFLGRGGAATTVEPDAADPFAKALREVPEYLPGREKAEFAPLLAGAALAPAAAVLRRHAMARGVTLGWVARLMLSVGQRGLGVEAVVRPVSLFAGAMEQVATRRPGAAVMLAGVVEGLGPEGFVRLLAHLGGVALPLQGLPEPPAPEAPAMPSLPDIPALPAFPALPGLPGLDELAQAAALLEAARDGLPFCEECAKAAAGMLGL